jgi:acetylornithine deacetylase/succinyl-diaminopimelate desuccinylase-like protein
MPPVDLERLNAIIARDLERNIADLGRLVAIPSVAAQNRGIDECAALVATLLRDRGYTAEVVPSDGSPVVLADTAPGAPGTAPKDGTPTLLFYNHYDVQPAEPLELWDSEPFALARDADRLVARGVSDDKGHFISRLAALDAVRELSGGTLPCRVKFVVEGEEEVGSVSMPAFVEKHRQRLAADACVWEFGGVDEGGRPMQYLGLRGICYVELSVTTARMDAHSGIGGSIFPNAAWRLVWALASLKGPDERIRIPGHYDSVQPPSPRDLDLLEAMPDTAAEMLEFYGLSGFLGGLTGGPELRRSEVFLPTCTIAGLDSGYQGPGSKTIIPATAKAKVDFRLVPDQSPAEVLRNLRAHLDAQGFADVAIANLGGGRPAKTDPDDPFILMANEAARLAYGVPPVVSPMIGGSGPNWPFTHTLGLPITSCGIGYPGARVHAPNEHVLLEHLVSGIRHAALITLGFAGGNRLE